MSVWELSNKGQRWHTFRPVAFFRWTVQVELCRNFLALILPAGASDSCEHNFCPLQLLPSVTYSSVLWTGKRVVGSRDPSPGARDANLACYSGDKSNLVSNQLSRWPVRIMVKSGHHNLELPFFSLSLSLELLCLCLRRLAWPEYIQIQITSVTSGARGKRAHGRGSLEDLVPIVTARFWREEKWWQQL